MGVPRLCGARANGACAALVVAACFSVFTACWAHPGFGASTDDVELCQNYLNQVGERTTLSTLSSECTEVERCLQEGNLPGRNATGTATATATAAANDHGSRGPTVTALQLREEADDDKGGKDPDSMTWTKPPVRGTAPPTLHGQGAWCRTDALYLVGGCEYELCEMKLHRYEYATETWKTIVPEGASLINGRRGAAYVNFFDKVFLIGGFAVGEGDYIDSVAVIDIGDPSDEGKHIVSNIPAVDGSTPKGRSYATATLVDNRAFFFGGSSLEAYDNTLYVFALDTTTWTTPDTLGAPPSGRQGHAAAAMGHVIYLFGGQDHMGACLNDLYTLNTATMHWKSQSASGTRPTPRSGHAAVTVGKKVFVYGGCDRIENVCYGDVFALDTAGGNLVWHTIKTLGDPARPRMDMSIVYSEELNSIQVYGGCHFEKKCFRNLEYLWEDNCPNDCSSPVGGSCVNFKCKCNKGFTGGDCSQKQPCSPSANCHDNGVCTLGECMCDKGFSGIGCNHKLCPGRDGGCSGHGSCHQPSGVCECEEGWDGEACLKAAPKKCVPKCVNGKCDDGTCQCEEGYAGPDCNRKLCPKNCSHRGTCTDGKCACDIGFKGVDCSQKILCPGECSAKGTCLKSGKCECNPGYSGKDCSYEVTIEEPCPDNCNHHGTCNKADKTCKCDAGYLGDHCQHREKVCPGNCNDRGVCDVMTGVCECKEQFSGKSCELAHCPKDCSEHGWCNKASGECTCDKMYAGSDCSIVTCPNSCSMHGQCTDVGSCICEKGYGSDDCSRQLCPRDCSGNGSCNRGVCACLPDWGGADCASARCAESCGDHGVCMKGVCECEEGYTGTACQEMECPKTGTPPRACSGNGVCDPKTGTCACLEGWKGPICSREDLKCPSDCYGNGECVNGKCMCSHTHIPPFCEFKVCPFACNFNGRCNKNGECLCEEGFGGDDCGTALPCGDCNGHGSCAVGGLACECIKGWAGRTCLLGAGSCPDDCSGHGTCKPNGVCECEAGFAGDSCGMEVSVCNPSCANGGVCNKNICQCRSNFYGDTCELHACPNDCSGKGICSDQGTCACNTGFGGPDCSLTVCQGDCNGKGQCVAGKCQCIEGFKGSSCQLSYCPGKCSHRGECVRAGREEGAAPTPAKCWCDEGFSGPNCADKECPQKCLGRGQCDKLHGVCHCEPGWYGASCSMKGCLNNCHGSARGMCQQGLCVCHPGFGGADCSLKVCVNHCSKKGKCVDGACHCNEGYYGDTCEKTVPCPMDCSGHGKCANKVCNCEPGWLPPSCAIEQKSCPKGLGGKPCSGPNHGSCLFPSFTCQCKNGQTGLACQLAPPVLECPEYCSGQDNGVCDPMTGKCFCKPNFVGEDCSLPKQFHDESSETEDNNQESGGAVPGGWNVVAGGRKDTPATNGWKVVADNKDATPFKAAPGVKAKKGEKFTNVKPCPSSCNGHGLCDEGRCYCEPGWTGPSCSKVQCEQGCNQHGACVNMQCDCYSGYKGETCRLNIDCKNNCTDAQGYCFDECYCKSGYTGEDCSEYIGSGTAANRITFLLVYVGVPAISFLIGGILAMIAIKVLNMVLTGRKLKKGKPASKPFAKTDMTYSLHESDSSSDDSID